MAAVGPTRRCRTTSRTAIFYLLLGALASAPAVQRCAAVSDLEWSETTAGGDAPFGARTSFRYETLPAASAAPGDVLLLGGSTNADKSGVVSSVWKGTAPYGPDDWTEQTPAAGWVARFYFASAVQPDGDVYVMGGMAANGGSYNDVWRSADAGATWAKVLDPAPFPGTYQAAGCADADGDIFFMGGYSGSSRRNTIYKSTNDGAAFSQVTVSGTMWSARDDLGVVAHWDSNTILVAGGDAGDAADDVWASTDKGVTWTQVSSSPPWAGHCCGGLTVAPSGAIVYAGGGGWLATDLNKVFVSTDVGATWTTVESDAPWMGRDRGGASVTEGGLLVVFGGYSNDGTEADVWTTGGLAGTLGDPDAVGGGGGSAGAGGGGSVSIDPDGLQSNMTDYAPWVAPSTSTADSAVNVHAEGDGEAAVALAGADDADLGDAFRFARSGGDGDGDGDGDDMRLYLAQGDSVLLTASVSRGVEVQTSLRVRGVDVGALLVALARDVADLKARVEELEAP